MTSNESFKARVRTRMARTGERYLQARRALLERADRPGAGGWVSEPEVSDRAVREATGHGWDEWVALVERAPVDLDDRATVARWVAESHEVGTWWAQTVTGGWERITGRRLPGQMPDGTFTVNRTRTLPAGSPGVDELRAMVLDDHDRAALFPGMDTELRSRATATSLRVGMPDGMLLVAIEEREDARTRVSLAHSGLSDPAAVELWREHWGDWLTALADA